ncbi:MAG: hypothetical protein ACREPG_00295 [Candidatus Binatia bacterium]
MVDYQKHRYERVVRAWRQLAKRLVAVSVAIALIALILPMPAGGASEEDMSTISMSFNAGEQGQANNSGHAYATHMNIEHHQLVRIENAFVIPAAVSIRVGYLIDGVLLNSREPAPLFRPPRA